MITIKSGVSIAATTALLALATLATTPTPAYAGHKAETVHCYGVNACKGQSDCKSGSHDCKGMNDCKGQGFKTMTSKACTAAGGSETAPTN